MKTNLKQIIFTTSLTLFSACTPYTESFDCPPGRGVGCQSLSTVNQMVEEGKLPYEKPPLKDDSVDKEKENVFSQEPLMIEANIPLMSDDIKSHPTSHVKVWLAGYEDSHGNDRFYHAPSLVYVAR
jgi:hypothetical protein